MEKHVNFFRGLSSFGSTVFEILLFVLVPTLSFTQMKTFFSSFVLCYSEYVTCSLARTILFFFCFLAVV